MAKPILFYALVTGHHPHGHGFRLLGVTSEKGRQVYGRDPDSDMVTHRSDRDVLHRFLPEHTEEFCRAAHDRAGKMQQRLIGNVTQAEQNACTLRSEMARQILSAAKGER